MIWLMAQAVHAAPSVEMTVTSVGGGVFQYDFSISNFGISDLAIVSITDAPPGDGLINSTLVAPAGFLASYDSGLGFVDFLGDVSVFAAGTTTSGFSFQSAALSDAYFNSFEALGVLGESFSGDIRRISTIPDRGNSLVLLGAGLLALMALGSRSQTFHSQTSNQG
jgi:hypothetical protein